MTSVQDPPQPCVRYEVRGAVALITLDRPERLNALNAPLKAELANALFVRARQDAGVRAVVLTGAGQRAFCAGADIKDQAARAEDPSDFIAAQQRTHALFGQIECFEKPIVGALNGAAVGGGLELALCLDMCIAAEGARLGLPELRLGVIPAAGGTQRLPRAIGAARAREMLFTGALIDAHKAAAWGLVSEVVAQADVVQRAMAVAERMASQAPLALRYAKLAIRRGLEGSFETGLEVERLAAGLAFASADRLEGMQAFLEKRPPRFQGR